MPMEFDGYAHSTNAVMQIGSKTAGHLRSQFDPFRNHLELCIIDTMTEPEALSYRKRPIKEFDDHLIEALV